MKTGGALVQVDTAFPFFGRLVITADDDRGLHAPCGAADGGLQSFSPGKPLAADTVINWCTRVNERGVVESLLEPKQRVTVENFIRGGC